MIIIYGGFQLVFSNTVLIQWGTTPHQSASGSITVTINIAYTNTDYFAFANPIGGNSSYVGIDSRTVTQFQHHIKTANTSPKNQCVWLTVGY